MAAIYQSGNVLLDGLPDSVLGGIRDSLGVRRLAAEEILYAGEAVDDIAFVFFPITAVTSMAAILNDGDFVEALPVGYEGLAGFQVVFGSARMHEQWVCSVPGTVAAMPVAAFWSLLNSSALLGRMLLCYEQSVISALAIAVTCNAKHSLLERCAKWLLLTQDRVRSHTFAMKHELLATMLGVRRAGVSTVAAQLQSRGGISYSRGRIVITDRAVLEREACQCYTAITAEYERLMVRSLGAVPAACKNLRGA